DLPTPDNGLVLELDVTAAASDVADTLDVFVQSKFDGTNWVDIAHFTQILGNGGAKRFITKITAELTQAEFSTASSLGATNVRQILGDQYRVRAVIVAGAGSHTFTFNVWGTPM